MFGKFKPAKCAAQLKQCTSRIQLLRNQREMRVKQITREIAELLRQGQEARAMLQVEQKLREEATLAAYDVVAVCCNTVCTRMLMVEEAKKCPPSLKGEIATIIFAAPRCGDLAELQELKTMFTAKFGKAFAAAAAELRPDCGVDTRVIAALTVHAPSSEAKLRVLAAIAAEYNVDWWPPSMHDDMHAPQPLAQQEAPPHHFPGTARSPRTPPGQRPPSPLSPFAHQSFAGADPAGATEAGPYRPPPPPDFSPPALWLQRNGAGATATATAGLERAEGGLPLSPLSDRVSPRPWPDERDGRFEPTRAQPQSGYSLAGYRSAPGGLDEFPGATAAALVVAAQQVSDLAGIVLASHVREQEARLREQLRSERNGRAAEDRARNSGSQYGGERQAWGQASGEWGAGQARSEAGSGRQWDGQSSQQRSPRTPSPYRSPEGHEYGQPVQGRNDRDERVVPPRGVSSSAGGTPEEQGAVQRASRDFSTARPASPDSLARRSDERDSSSEDDNSGPGTGVGATRGGGQRGAAGQEAGPEAFTGRRGYVSSNVRQGHVGHADARSARTVEGPQGGSLPPPPKHAQERGRFLKWTPPAAADNPHKGLPASPNGEMNGLSSHVRALKVGK